MNSCSKELDRIAKFSSEVQQIALAALLSNLFEKHNVLLTVVGGAAVQYYTDGEYVTRDVDAILSGDTKQIVEKVMSQVGFKRTTTYRHFEHPSFPFVVEFPPSPIEVGNRLINEVNILKVNNNTVRVIRIEDIMMDRIIAGVEWRDEPSLEQAKLLWLKNKKNIDRNYLTKFVKQEGYLKTLKEIMKSA